MDQMYILMNGFIKMITLVYGRTNNPIIKEMLGKRYDTFTDKANLAYKIQQETKNHTIKLLEKCFEHNDKVVLSGGYFQNCVNNYEYIKRFPTKKFYIDPICHDGGTSIGAAKYLWHQVTNDKTIRKLPTLLSWIDDVLRQRETQSNI